MLYVNLLSANPTKWSNTLKQFISSLPTNCLSGFDHFVKMTLKGLMVAFFKINWHRYLQTHNLEFLGAEEFRRIRTL